MGVLTTNKAINLLERMISEINMCTPSTSATSTTEKAANGKTGSDPETCGCCSPFKNSALSWWSVDLGGLYSIARITVIGRMDGMYHGTVHVLRNKTF